MVMYVTTQCRAQYVATRAQKSMQLSHHYKKAMRLRYTLMISVNGNSCSTLNTHNTVSNWTAGFQPGNPSCLQELLVNHICEEAARLQSAPTLH